jgi:hypothetical protein
MKKLFSMLFAVLFVLVGKSSAVSNSATRSVTVIDATSLKPIINIPVGEVPKRLSTLDLGKIK